MDDLAKLNNCEPDDVKANLEKRFNDKKIYTRNGSVLIAINPYATVDLYTQAHVEQYKAALSLEQEPPHIFAVASAAHRNMISAKMNQAVVISGESGAGKTESARFVLQYLRFVSNATDELEKRIDGSQPITEAFGCAKTLRNDNSSRFGKFLMLHFNQSAKIQGASLSTYLLEKSRVTHVSPGERAYHIFYALLRGLPKAVCDKIKLESGAIDKYRYLSVGETGKNSGHLDDTQIYSDVVGAMTSQAIPTDEQELYWACVAGVLQLGNVVFDEANKDAATVTAAATTAIQNSETVLGLQSGMLQKALCKKKIKAGGEFIEQEMSLEQAVDGRDALSKAIYSRLFDRLIVQINEALSAGQETIKEGEERRIIGVVDIFGFEVFKINSLEQLCINFANEKLQSLFTKTVFAETIAAYKADGIDAADITYQDNGALIKMFDEPKVGLWAVLSEECCVPKGNDSGFSEKFHAAQKGCSVLSVVKGQSAREGFGISHFAGPVTYSVKGWLNKNKDPLNADLMVLMQFSDNAVLKSLFSAKAEGQQPTAGTKFKSNKFKGVIDAFCTGLGELYSVLDASALHFVRCFKPNDGKLANTWDAETVTRQLNTSGVLDALRVARSGYPDRMVYKEFVGMFAFIGGMGKGTPPSKAACEELVGKLGLDAKTYKLGTERIFMMLGVLDSLKTKRLEAMLGVAKKVQAGGRGMVARRRARGIRTERADKLAAMDKAAAGDDIEALRAAISVATAAGVGKSKLVPAQQDAVSKAQARLAQLEKEAAEREAATKALAAATESSKLEDLEKLKAAVADAKAKGVDAGVLAKGEAALKVLVEEERLRKEEEERLKAIADAAAKAAEEKRLAEERKKREEEEAARKAAEEEAEREAEAEKQAAEEAARKEAEEAEANKDQIEAAKREAEAEALRARVLEKLTKTGAKFASEPEDVIEFALYLGMNLDEDQHLFWIADEALQQPEDPEGWIQQESPNGEVYYVNEVTEMVLWQHPLDYEYQQKYEAEKKKGKDAAKGPAKPVAAPKKEEPKKEEPKKKKEEPADDTAKMSEDQLKGLVQGLLCSKNPDLRTLLLEPAQETKQPLVRGYVIRHKAGRTGGEQKFAFYINLSKSSDMYCFTAKKQASTKGCFYTIDLARPGKSSGESILGKVRSDKKSMDYNVYDDGATPESKEKGTLRRELLYVNFINSLRNRDPGAMDVVVPRTDKDGKPILVRPVEISKEGVTQRGLQERHKGAVGDVVVLKNREPKWNAATNMYQLDFQGRATMASCKNIQLHPKDSAETDVCFLMGKVDDNKFNVDFKHPFSALQAFSFAMIVFDNSSGL